MGLLHRRPQAFVVVSTALTSSSARQRRIAFCWCGCACLPAVAHAVEELQWSGRNGALRRSRRRERQLLELQVVARKQRTRYLPLLRPVDAAARPRRLVCDYKRHPRPVVGRGDCAARPGGSAREPWDLAVAGRAAEARAISARAWRHRTHHRRPWRRGGQRGTGEHTDGDRALPRLGRLLRDAHAAPLRVRRRGRHHAGGRPGERQRPSRCARSPPRRVRRRRLLLLTLGSPRARGYP
mmetsp:Transcript_28404/g.62200  ORF Transcript_28404/g.62200 Transcript_28404/m.62200 type:complete len:239 (-) Transcript_28404:613-1329(-)